MMESPKFKDVNTLYDTGAWSKDRVHAAVGRWITKEEYAEITGEKYE